MPSQLTSLPNLVTYARIAAVPVICLLIAPGSYWLRWLALIIFIAAAASDWVDGYLARKLDQGSALGRMLDPIADKLLVSAVLVVLAWDRSLSALDLVPAIAIVLRETFIPGLREYLGNIQITVPVTTLAKWKTTVQLVALGFVIAEFLIPGLGLVSDLVLWLAAALTVWTGADYFMRTWPHLK
jgi:CDP-diacylglycerol--glycerol-3-phosphate 3-phosphatidyltransferase